MARTIRLHLSYPQGWTHAREFVDKLQTVFNSFGAEISFVIGNDNAVTDPRLQKVDPGSCTNAPSSAATALFKALAPVGMGNDEIAVLFAGELVGPVKWGCSQCPPGWRGVMVSCQAPPVALTHEVAHLFLGSGHDSDPANLMFADSSALSLDPPTLLPTQLQTIRAGAWALPVGAVQFALAAARLPVMTEVSGGEAPKTARNKARPAPKKARRAPRKKGGRVPTNVLQAKSRSRMIRKKASRKRSTPKRPRRSG